MIDELDSAIKALEQLRSEENPDTAELRKLLSTYISASFRYRGEIEEIIGIKKPNTKLPGWE